MCLHQLDGLNFDLAFEIGKSELILESQNMAAETQEDTSTQHKAWIDVTLNYNISEKRNADLITVQNEF